MSRIESSEVVAAAEITAPDVVVETDHFVSLGWRIVDVFPADDPHRITIDGHGLRLVVSRGASRHTRILLPGGPASRSVSPGGNEVVFGIAELEVPPLVSSPAVSRADGPDVWHIGRAGMLYRDLVPDRQGGAVIASHIRIPTGGPVPDYPHFHDVVFQLIFVHRGWVRLAYEAQGEPFVLHAGECVIQPPRIRHRVLESSDDLHVVEVGYPAEHLTIADHDFDFMASPPDPARVWDGQRFVRFTRAGAHWEATASGARVADTGVSTATAGRADVRVVRLEKAQFWEYGPIGERRFSMIFVLDGRVRSRIGDSVTHLQDSDSAVVPVGSDAHVNAADEATLLVVTIDTD